MTPSAARLAACPFSLSRWLLLVRALAALLLICACALLVARADAAYATTTPFAVAIYNYDQAAPNAQGALTSAPGSAPMTVLVQTSRVRLTGHARLPILLAAESATAAARLGRTVSHVLLSVDPPTRAALGKLCSEPMPARGIRGHIATKTLGDEFVIFDFDKGEGGACKTVDIPRGAVLAFQELHQSKH